MLKTKVWIDKYYILNALLLEGKTKSFIKLVLEGFAKINNK
jgi:hypothetical protein